MFSLFLVVLLATNSLLSIVFYLQGAMISEEFFYFSLLIFLLLLSFSSKNLLYLIRVLILGCIGFIAASSQLLFDDALFGIHLQDSQTIEVVSLMLLMTNVALFSSHLGFVLASKVSFGKRVIHEVDSRIEGVNFFFISFLLFIFVSILLDLSRGSLIIGSGYGSLDEEKLDTGLGNLNTIANSLLFFMLLLYLKFEGKSHFFAGKFKKILIFSVFYYVLYVNFLHGSRMDALNALFGLFVIYKVYSEGDVKVTFKIFFIGFILFVLVQTIGTIRSVLSHVTFEEFIFLFQRIFINLIQNPNSGIVFYQGTLNDIATTFSGIIFLVKQGVVDFLYGSSYLDYFLRIPPSFLYPDRPQDLSWTFVNNGFTSGGGFFELAEVYYNFGFWGAFFVPFLVTFIIFHSYKLFKLCRGNVFHSLLFIAVLSVYLRGLLYQNFAFFKAVITVYILYYMIVFVVGFLKRSTV